MEADNTPEKKTQDDLVAIELPAPAGWKKKFTPKKGGTPRRNEIVFISPTGEEIKTKRQLELYLKSHPGGPSASEFDWGTGDTPRRSARLSEKSKATEPSESEAPRKKQKRSSSKKVGKETKDAADKGEAVDENEGTDKVPVADAEDAGEKGDKEVVTEDAVPHKDGTKDAEQKADEGAEVAKEAEADKEEKDVMLETIATDSTTMNEVTEGTNMDKVEDQETGDEPHDVMEEDPEDKPLPSKEPKDSHKEAEGAPGGPETPSSAGPHEAASTGQVSVAVDSSTSKQAEAVPKQPVDSNVGQVDQSS